MKQQKGEANVSPSFNHSWTRPKGKRGGKNERKEKRIHDHGLPCSVTWRESITVALLVDFLTLITTSYFKATSLLLFSFFLNPSHHLHLPHNPTPLPLIL